MKLLRFYMERMFVKAEKTAKDTFEGKGFSKNLPEKSKTLDIKRYYPFRFFIKK